MSNKTVELLVTLMRPFCFICLWSVTLLLPHAGFAQPTCGVGYSANSYCHYHNYTNIFVGRVVSLKPEDGRVSYPFNVTEVVVIVERSLKGSAPSIVRLDTKYHAKQGGCYGRIEIGARYIFNAMLSDTEGQLARPQWASLTELSVEEEQKVFAGIQNLVNGGRQPSVSGIVKMEDHMPLSNFQIVAKISDEEFTTTTDRNGEFAFDRLPDGQVTITPYYPKALRASDPLYHKNWQGTIRNNSPCGWRVGFVAAHSGQITGEIAPDRTKLGRFPNSYLYAVPAGKISEDTIRPVGEPGTYYEDTNPNGPVGFKFDKVPPGRYTIKLVFDREHPELSTFYFPGVQTIEKASAFDLGAGERLDLRLSVPAMHPVFIPVEVSLANGRTIGGSVSLIDALEPSVAHGYYLGNNGPYNGKTVFTFYLNRPFHLCAGYNGIKDGKEVRLYSFVENLIVDKKPDQIAVILDQPIPPTQLWYEICEQRARDLLKIKQLRRPDRKRVPQ